MFHFRSISEYFTIIMAQRFSKLLGAAFCFKKFFCDCVHFIFPQTRGKLEITFRSEKISFSIVFFFFFRIEKIRNSFSS